MLRISEASTPSPLTQATEDGIVLHADAEPMPAIPAGPFVRTPDGDIVSVAGKTARLSISADEGRTWEPCAGFPPDPAVESADTGALLCTRQGTVIVAFANLAEKANWNWDPELKDSPGARLPTYVARSLDGGRTWQDLRKLHDEWTGATRCMIQTRAGRVIFTSMKLLHKPGRHSVMTYDSDDEGKTWRAGTLLDLGGNGHHDGLTEGSIVELNDGRIMQYIRTNWGQLWRAYSADGGATFHPYGPAGIPASSTPPQLRRLASGRIVLLWNRPFPEGTDCWELRGGDGIWSATPASNYREQLSISFSEDEGESWSPSVVIAENKGSEVCYPYVFEPTPGRLWITAHRWNLRMALREEAFLR